MNQPHMQMTAGAAVNSDASQDAHSRVRDERPAARQRGLDTGARGWRWMPPARRTAQMQAGEPAPGRPERR